MQLVWKGMKEPLKNNRVFNKKSRKSREKYNSQFGIVVVRMKTVSGIVGDDWAVDEVVWEAGAKTNRAVWVHGADEVVKTDEVLGVDEKELENGVVKTRLVEGGGFRVVGFI